MCMVVCVFPYQSEAWCVYVSKNNAITHNIRRERKKKNHKKELCMVCEKEQLSSYEKKYDIKKNIKIVNSLPSARRVRISRETHGKSCQMFCVILL